MKSDRLWIALAGAAVGAVLVALAPLGAQRAADPRPAADGAGRYQVVRVTEGEIILLDTATGDLYAAGPQDVKPHAARPKAADARPFALPTATTARTTAPATTTMKKEIRAVETKPTEPPAAKSVEVPPSQPK